VSVSSEPLHLVWFAGGGGSSCGAKMHLGRDVDYALNHDAVALRMHEVNHPGAIHMCADAFAADPEELEHGRPIGTMWFSPDCTHHSVARGSAPKSERIRGLCWCILPWARRSAAAGGPPAVIFIENVAEFQDYGPLFPDDHPQAGSADPAHKGESFAEFNQQLRDAGYVGEWRELVVANYSSPKLSPEGGETTRKRLFGIFRHDGLPIVWPERTNAPRHEAEANGLKPWAPAASFIDFGLPCPSIFMSQDAAKAQGLRIKRPLSPATRRRIARGVERYVIAAAEPFIFPTTHQGDSRVHGIGDPLRTVTSAHRGEFALGAAHLGRQFGSTVSGRDIREPAPTVMAGRNGGGKSQLVASYLTMFNENSIGRLPDVPLHTVMAGATRHGLVAAFLNTYYATGVGSDLGQPVRTVTGEDRHALVAPSWSRPTPTWWATICADRCPPSWARAARNG
jgi:DNA (cytosine-5)-methyltransferase 1